MKNARAFPSSLISVSPPPPPTPDFLYIQFELLKGTVVFYTILIKVTEITFPFILMSKINMN